MTRFTAKPFNFRALIAAAALTLASGLAAQAATIPADVTVSAQSSSRSDARLFQDANGRNAWWGNVWVSNTGDWGWKQTAAGMFRLTATDGQGWAASFNAFCLEFAQTLNLPTVYRTLTAGTEGATGLTAVAAMAPAVLDNVGKLFTNAYAEVKDSKTAVAFQLALWEITSEKSATLSLTSGNFRGGHTGFFDYGARDLANGWLAKLPAWQVEDRFVSLLADRSQDLVTDIPVPADPEPQPAPVPLPASGLLLIAGLGGLAALRRRRG